MKTRGTLAPPATSNKKLVGIILLIVGQMLKYFMLHSVAREVAVLDDVKGIEMKTHIVADFLTFHAMQCSKATYCVRKME